MASLKISTSPHKEPKQKDYIEITELPIPDKKTEPPKKAKLLAEKSYKAKEEKTIDRTTRLSKPKITKVQKPKKKPESLPKRTPPRDTKREKKIKTPPKASSKTVAREKDTYGLSTKRKDKVASLLKQQPSKVERKSPVFKKKNPPIKDILKYPLYSQPSYDSKEPLYGSDKAHKKEDTVDLNTKEFKYLSYFTHLKRKIEGVWNYPEESILRGEQGRLFLMFTLNKNGEVEDIKLIDSSGYKNLDKEAIRAIKIASPFNPFPKSWRLERLHVRASFEYSFQRFIR